MEDFFFGEHWASTLRRGPDGIHPHIRRVRKRNYSTIERPQKRSRIGDDVSLSDLRFLSLSDEIKSLRSSIKPGLANENVTRKRSLNLSGDIPLTLKRRKRSSSVLGDGPRKTFLPSPAS